MWRDSRKEPDIRMKIREIPLTGGKGNGSRGTPCNMIDARAKGDKDAI
jgi:hypothetical protein